MNSKDEQKRTARHTADEARAIQRQQADAGPTHSPVKTPASSLDPETNAMLKDARADERNRCADLLDGLIAEHSGRGLPAVELQRLVQLAAQFRQA